VKSDRSIVVFHHFGLGRTIGFQSAKLSGVSFLILFTFCDHMSQIKSALSAFGCMQNACSLSYSVAYVA